MLDPLPSRGRRHAERTLLMRYIAVLRVEIQVQIACRIQSCVVRCFLWIHAVAMVYTDIDLFNKKREKKVSLEWGAHPLPYPLDLPVPRIHQVKWLGFGTNYLLPVLY